MSDGRNNFPSVPPNVTWPMVAYKLVKELAWIVMIVGMIILGRELIMLGKELHAVGGLLSTIAGIALAKSRLSDT